MKNESKVSAFSLVELVIVVVIIGVIAAIAVPRISRGAKGAGDSSLRGTLAGLCNAIDMFAAEHGGTFPSGTTTQEIVDKLVKKTDKDGVVGSPPVAGTHIFGPYLRGAIPALPVCANKGSVELEIVTGQPAPSGTKGWVYSTDTGQIIGNCTDSEVDESNVKYNSY